MAKTNGLYKWVALVIVSISSLFWAKFINAAPPKGFDFTVPADAPYEPGELLVRFAPKSDGKQRSIIEKSGLLDSLGGGIIKRNFKIVPGLALVELPAGLTVKDALKTFNRTDGILHAQPNYILRALSTFPYDPNFAQLWGMYNTGQPHPKEGGGFTSGMPDADIDAPEVWDIATDSDIILAVIDSGVAYNHPDLVANMWTDANGCYGYDFVNDDNDPMDDFYHGTHCAGTIGAVGNNGIGVTGVCWNVKIMAIKFLDWYGEGTIDGAIASIEYAVNMGAKVLSNSWGVYAYSEDLEDAIEAASTNGVLFIAAAGNEELDNDGEFPCYPASYDCQNIISILATTDNDGIADFSNYGPNSVDLGAPGVDILSTFPTYETDAMDDYGYSTYYETISGTSMATPHVAGACALAWSMNPTLSHLQVKDIILNTVDKLAALDGLCVSGGRLNLYNAVLEAAKNEEILNKVGNINDGNSVLPEDGITYNISCANPVSNPTLTDVNIIDYLPVEVNYYSSDPCGVYDPVNRTVTWNIGTLTPGQANPVTLIVKVNNLAEPLGTITNLCVLRNFHNY